MQEEKTVATNRKALRDYTMLERYECGIELKGEEVKSLRQGKVSIVDSFARIEREEVFLYNSYVAEYEKSSFFHHELRRRRRLLLHKSEIKRLIGKLTQGLTLIPLRIYFKGSWAKVELALAKKKRLYDKRRKLKREAEDREFQKLIKRYYQRG